MHATNHTSVAQWYSTHTTTTTPSFTFLPLPYHPMEERTLPTPHSGDDGDYPDDNNSQFQPAVLSPAPENNGQIASFCSGTYVIQVPMDPVYRIPSTKNAVIA